MTIIDRPLIRLFWGKFRSSGLQLIESLIISVIYRLRAILPFDAQDHQLLSPTITIQGLEHMRSLLSEQSSARRIPRHQVDLTTKGWDVPVWWIHGTAPFEFIRMFEVYTGMYGWRWFNYSISRLERRYITLLGRYFGIQQEEISITLESGFCST